VYHSRELTQRVRRAYQKDLKNNTPESSFF
jgi:hypothetical protein